MSECLSCHEPATERSSPFCDACLIRHQLEYEQSWAGQQEAFERWMRDAAREGK